MLKKMILLCLSFFLMTGCVPQNNSLQSLEACVWQMETMQDAGQNGSIVACRPGFVNAPQTAEQREILCTVSGSAITLSEPARNQSLTGKLTLQERDRDAAVWLIEMDGQTGIAGLSATQETGKPAVPTLILRIGDTALTFYPQ